MREKDLDKVVVLIPSLDPDIQMVKYVKALRDRGFEKIVVVDDGSKEETQKFFYEVRGLEEVTILKHSVNQGKGRALKTGFNYIMNTYKKEEILGVITADADGQHSPKDTQKVAMYLMKNNGLVLGTRDFKEKNVPFKSRNGNKITTVVFSLLYGKRIEDTQTGLRGIPYSFLSDCMKFVGERFEYEIVMLIEAVRKKMKIVEIPIETIYIDSNRATHFHAIKDSFRIYRVILRSFFRYTVSGLSSFFVDIGIFAFLTKVVFASIDVTKTIVIGSIIARIVSSFWNYILNKSTVFQNRQHMSKSLPKYYVLCLIQLVCSSGLVTLMYQFVKWDTTLIKTLIDLFLFFISFQVQRLWVFKEE